MKLGKSNKEKQEQTLAIADVPAIVPAPAQPQTEILDYSSLLEERKEIVRMIEEFKMTELKEDLNELDLKIAKCKPYEAFQDVRPEFIVSISDLNSSYFNFGETILRLTHNSRVLEFGMTLNQGLNNTISKLEEHKKEILRIKCIQMSRNMNPYLNQEINLNQGINLTNNLSVNYAA